MRCILHTVQKQSSRVKLRSGESVCAACVSSVKATARGGVWEHKTRTQSPQYTSDHTEVPF